MHYITTRTTYMSESNTRTHTLEKLNAKYLKEANVQHLIERLHAFNEANSYLRQYKNRHDLYNEFYIPKRSGGLRKIDAPKPELKAALYTLVAIFETDFHALYHTAAHAYIKNRSIITCMRRHQENESKWFSKFDLSNFFGSTTLDFVVKMFSMIYPFSVVLDEPTGHDEFVQAIELAFLDGGLPQGTPISPLITNVMMIPIDYTLTQILRNYNNIPFVYTRYADDFQISSKYAFDYKDVENIIIKTLEKFEAPFSIKQEKTRYGSSSGRNWNLGLMLNKDNQLTIGYRKKKQFQAMISSYIMDHKNGIKWPLNDIQRMEGYYNYYCEVERDTIEGMVQHINEKFNVNLKQLIQTDKKEYMI